MTPESVTDLELPGFTTSADRSQLRLFAKVIGETGPVHTDVGAARAAGYRDLLLPPTFLFTLELLRPDPTAVLRHLGIDQREVLHGEQHFTYHSPAVAGDELTFEMRVVDYYERKGGALRFVVRESEVTRGGERVATLQNTLVARRLELSS